MRVRPIGRKHGSVAKRGKLGLEPKQWKLLLWTALAGLIFGLIEFGSIAEDVLRAGRNSLHWHRASGDIVLVKIDEQSLREVGRWPWPRRYHAQLTDRLSEAGAKRIFFDISFFGATNPADDRSFADALKRSGRAILATRTRSGPNCDNCVEVAFVEEAIAVRDSKNPTGPALIFTAAEWDAFVGGAKDGEFDR